MGITSCSSSGFSASQLISRSYSRQFPVEFSEASHEQVGNRFCENGGISIAVGGRMSLLLGTRSSLRLFFSPYLSLSLSLSLLA